MARAGRARSQSRKAPRLDERLELELLELVARHPGARPLNAAKLAPAGWQSDEVWRQLRAICSEGLIDYISTKHLRGDGMLLQRLTPAGWRRLEELRERYNRPIHWSLSRWWPIAERWILYLLVPVGLTLLGWLVLA
jgi:hypothetical protein